MATCFSGALAGGLVLGTSAAQAQSASQITPRDFRPPVEGGGGAIAIPEGRGLQAPQGAERLTVRLSGVSIEGGLQALAEAERALSERLSARTVTAAEIFAAARELESAYAAVGYVLARVVLPPQRLVSGAPLRLVVVDGFVERIDTSNLPENVRGRIDTVLAPLTGRHGITLREIERLLLLAGDTPGTALRSTLTAGATEGATILVVEARYRPVIGSFTADNTLSRALGRWSTGIGLDLNSILGFGELFYVRASGYPSGGTRGFFERYPRNRALAGGVIVPIGTDGLTLNLEGTQSRATPLFQSGTGFTSSFERLSARLRYPLIRGRDLTLNAELSVDAQDEAVSFIAPLQAPISLDRLRIVRASGDALWLMPTGGVATGRLVASFGIDGLGARSARDATPDLPLSRQGADAEFQKLEIAAGFNQPLAEHLAFDFRARAQTSFNRPLLRSEQIGIATPTGLSTFDAGTLQGDSGYVVRAELQAPFQVAVPGGALIAAPYLFGAGGQIHLEQPTALERANVRAAAYGLGLRLAGAPQASFSQASMTIEYGREARSDPVRKQDRLTFSLALQF